MMDNILITPSIIPSKLRDKKSFNSGDLYVQQLTQKFLMSQRLISNDIGLISSWGFENDQERKQFITQLKEGSIKHVFLAGTNCFRQDFNPCKEIDIKLWSEIADYVKIFVLFGGIFGVNPGLTKTKFVFNDQSKSLIRSILSNGAISCRCKITFDLLREYFDDQCQNLYYTGCVSTLPFVNKFFGFTVSLPSPKILFSFTSRNLINATNEAKDLIHIIKLFPTSQIAVIVNQRRIHEPLLRIIKKSKLKIIDATSIQDVTSYFNTLSHFDLHVGSRAHVHIPMISMGIRSFLTGFEERHLGFQLTYGQSPILCGAISKYSLKQLLFDSLFDETANILNCFCRERSVLKSRLKQIIGQIQTAPSSNLNSIQLFYEQYIKSNATLFLQENCLAVTKLPNNCTNVLRSCASSFKLASPITNLTPNLISGHGFNYDTPALHVIAFEPLENMSLLSFLELFVDYKTVKITFSLTCPLSQAHSSPLFNSLATEYTLLNSNTNFSSVDKVISLINCMGYYILNQSTMPNDASTSLAMHHVFTISKQQ